jgi:hypothetical protein
MKLDDFRKWASEHPGTAGSGAGIDCESIADAESYVTDYPVDAHDFATCGTVSVPYTIKEDTLACISAMFAAAGYGPSVDSWRERDGFRAQATYHEQLRYATIYVYRADAWVAYAIGEDGYLPSGDTPIPG